MSFDRIRIPIPELDLPYGESGKGQMEVRIECRGGKKGSPLQTGLNLEGNKSAVSRT